ncbi:hypothetical protein [Pyxidicoccus xibeiensis]|uniref:hypothetical protein n=1 Tax=Pyxidicoccus xibeiensis TaxID=2906759 RepID=UPI0020A76CF0|nr:hypothetical protein [Pyxidicoccus xibeiensis]MCP3143937.1 hypothetical protein [Pyxidicoccus xibeiensis]
MSEPRTVALTALGAATSLGGIVQAAAAARAGIVRTGELTGCWHLDDELNEPIPVTGHPAAWLTDGFEGLGRFMQLGVSALTDLLATSPHIQRERTGFFLALPHDVGQEEDAEEQDEEAQDGGEDEEAQEPPSDGEGDEDIAAPAPLSPEESAQRLMEHLFQETELAFRPEAIRVFLEGRKGTILAVQQAVQALLQGRYHHALVMACDSLVDPWRAQRMLRARRIKTSDNPVGFMPGEAGVAILLERLDTVRTRRDEPLALLFEPVTAHEAHNRAEQRHSSGAALVEVIAGAMERAGAIASLEGSVYLDLNGEDFRAREWGGALVRARGRCQVGAWAQRLPALSFGETGTAAPLLALGLATRAFARGYGRGGQALILASDDHGARAGMVLKHDASGRAK